MRAALFHSTSALDSSWVLRCTRNDLGEALLCEFETHQSTKSFKPTIKLFSKCGSPQCLTNTSRLLGTLQIASKLIVYVLVRSLLRATFTNICCCEGIMCEPCQDCHNANTGNIIIYTGATSNATCLSCAHRLKQVLEPCSQMPSPLASVHFHWPA